jgi:superfamily II DNA/RNA helicase
MPGCCVRAVRLIKTIRRKNPAVQLLLFSATYNDKVKEFAMRIAPNANQVRPGHAIACAYMEHRQVCRQI